MKTEGVRRTFLFAYVAIGIAQICEIGFNYLLYKSFSVDEVGVYAWAAAVVVFFNMTVDLGVEPILIRKFGSESPSLKNAYIATFVPRLPILFAGLVIILVLLSQNYLNSSRFWLLALIGGQSFFNISDSICKAWLRAYGLQTHSNFMAAGIGVLKLLSILLLIRSEAGNILELMALLLLSRALISILSLAFVCERDVTIAHQGVESASQLMRSNLKSGIVIGGIGFLTAIQNRLDWLLVSYFVSTSALAGYALANKFFEISQVIVGASLTTVYPWLCKSREISLSLNVILRLVIAAGALMGAIGAACGPWLVRLLFDDKYAGAEHAVMILMLAVGLMASSGVLYQVLLAKGLERSLLRVAAVTTGFQTMCNLVLIQVAGITGAAIGMLLLVLMTTGGLCYVVLKREVMSMNVVARILAFLTIYIVWTGIAMVWMPSVPIIGIVGGLLVTVAAWYVLFTANEQAWLRLRAGELVRVFYRAKQRKQR